MTTITPELRTKVADIISQGLVKGLGDPEPGKLCLEAAICLAIGEGHGDEPSCVAEPDRRFAIRLQDAYPGSPEDRARVFLPLGLAQLGTAGTYRLPWVKRVAEGVTRTVLPIMLRAAAERLTGSHKAALLETAVRCEVEGTRDSALNARRVAAAAAYDSAAYDSAASAAYAAAYAAAASADASASSDAYASDASAYAAAAAADADASDASARRHAIEAAVAVAINAYHAEGRS